MSAAPIPFAVALERVRELGANHRTERCTMRPVGARGAVLASDVIAPLDLPGFDNSAMDGFALRGADLPAAGERVFTLDGEVFAGATSAPQVGTGECARITTGAPVPPGADTVVIKESVTIDGDRALCSLGAYGLSVVDLTE